MKQIERLISTLLGAAILLAPTAHGASFSLKRSTTWRTRPKFELAPTASGATFSVRRSKTWRPSSKFKVRKYQRLERTRIRYTPLRSLESRAGFRRQNYMPTNQQQRKGINRYYERPQRTRQSRDPSQRYAGRKRRTIRRRVRWAANR